MPSSPFCQHSCCATCRSPPLLPSLLPPLPPRDLSLNMMEGSLNSSALKALPDIFPNLVYLG
jgi:hypothetical protein